MNGQSPNYKRALLLGAGAGAATALLASAENELSKNSYNEQGNLDPAKAALYGYPGQNDPIALGLLGVPVGAVTSLIADRIKARKGVV